MSGGPVALQELLDKTQRGQRPGQIKSLSFVAAAISQPVELRLALDALGGHVSQTLAERENGGGDRRIRYRVVDVLHEGFVDLDLDPAESA